VIEKTYMPTSIITSLDESVLYASIYQYIETQLQLTIKSAHKIIRAAKPNDMDKKYLHCENTDPVLEVEQIAFLDNGTIFEYSFSRHRFDKFEFHSFSVQK
jgi:GntR family transcriptional regulator